MRQNTEQLFKIWEKLEILVGDDSRQGRYEARIEDFINGGIVITHPEFIDGGRRLRDNMPVVVNFTRDDAAYQFHSKIRTRNLRGSRQMVLTPPVRIQRVQRRMFVRIETGSLAEYVRVIVADGVRDWEDCSLWTRSLCINISGGGALIEVSDDFKVKDPMLLRLEFLTRYDLPSTVAAITRRRVEQEKRKYIGVEFVLAENLDEYFKRDMVHSFPPSVKQFDQARREILVASIFAEQIEMRKKGLL